MVAQGYCWARTRLSSTNSASSVSRRTASCSVSPPWTTCRRPGCFCGSAAPRANYLLRVVPPGETAEYARQHGEAVSGCLATLLGIADATLPDDALRAARSPCVSVVSASAPRKKTAMPLTGRPGVTHCRSSRPGHQGSPHACSRLCNPPRGSCCRNHGICPTSRSLPTCPGV